MCLAGKSSASQVQTYVSSTKSAPENLEST